eukprot:TRINITY_DN9275_c0_g1_i2.p1 TRINITY_DN9275_c0_g1~~TRINITY_DN9275_c0_g1_i2.p1  ORF type:complete len:884 (-),score=100.29 TRINITY_DN9275_c0_g1_i2:461-2989(-)
MQGIDIGYSGHGRGNREGTEGGYGTQPRSNRERDGIESGYSTQNRDGTARRGDRDKDTSENRQNPESRSEARQETVVPQPEQIQYIEGEGCQVPVQPIEPPSLDTQYSTIHKSPSRRKSRAGAGMARSVPGTLDRRGNHDMTMDSCDTMDMPLTPASFAGLDHKELEERPLTALTTRMNKATVYDEPPEKTSLFITCSGLYAFLLIVICLAFLTSEVVTDNSPLHYYEGFFSFLYLLSIFFLFYVFCYLLHESTCCRSDPEPATYFQGGMDYCGLNDGYPHCQIKLKKYKTSENEQSHGSFFLRVGGLAFGLGTMVYIGLEFGSWFEIPWDSPCYQAVRGVNPVLQLIFTFSQMYFVFMNSRLNIHQFKCFARFGLMHIVATNICVWIRTVFKEGIKDIAAYRVARGEGVSEDYMIKEGYSILRQRFGNDSFWIHGPYHYIMKAIFQGTGVYRAFSLHPFTTGPPLPPMTSTTRAPPPFNPVYNNPLYPGGQPGYENMYPGQRAGFNNIIPYNATRQVHGMPGLGLDGLLKEGQTVAPDKFDNFTCGRIDLMGDIVTKSAPYLYPFLIEFSLIGAAVLMVMWARIGKNPRFWGDDDCDRVSVTSRKMITYTRVDCVGASKGLFFGLLVLVSALICLILFFVLIDHGELHVSQLAVFLADISHASIMILSVLAILLGFCRIRQMKFHGEDDSVLTDILLKVAACGVFAYATFSIIAGCLGDYRKPPNLVVMVTGIISIVQVILQLLFIQDVARRRIHSADQDRSKPGRQIVTFLLICNLAIWVIYTFEVQKVEESPVQIEFFGYQPWVIIQKLALPLCIFFRFHSTVALAEIWKNTYKTKLID